ncbi:hypothetical protein BJ322DRAFT_1177101 [Thelephora terrestris]|uniref:FBD domain-containing protein n=1 Tax=Thelephora terrestris TaxID=56493 RepID=A0A9P6HK55_9AGAM|nr:hypothetical protein BJ322DRAFT_1177101 [Thelephora terrestris]
MMQWRSHRGRGEKGKVVMKGEVIIKGELSKGESLLEKRKLRRRRGSSGEGEEALVDRKLRRRRRSSEEEDVPKEVAKVAKEFAKNPTSPELEALQRTMGQLKTLTVDGRPEYLNGFISHLSNTEPLLEWLELDGFSSALPGLFTRDLSSLHGLRLCQVKTELPWRNMTNLTSLYLQSVLPKISITQLLDFFEGALRLRTIALIYTISSSSGQVGQLVSLPSLKEMVISGYIPCAPLLGHLSIPAGAKLDIESESFDPSYENLFLRSPNNFKTLSNFTTVSFKLGHHASSAEFSGSNGKVSKTSEYPKANILMALEYLARLDSSTTEQLSISGGGLPVADDVHRALLPMQDLRTLMIRQCECQHAPIHSLSPQPQPSSVLLCPKLEELVLRPCISRKKTIIQSVIGMATSRALRGARLKTVRILGCRGEFDQEDVLELEKHALCMEFGAEGRW